MVVNIGRIEVISDPNYFGRVIRGLVWSEDNEWRNGLYFSTIWKNGVNLIMSEVEGMVKDHESYRSVSNLEFHWDDSIKYLFT